MDKYEREQAALLVESYVGFGDRAEIRLDCGMVIRCNNTQEALDNVARKLRKGFNVRSPRMPSRPLGTSPIKSVIARFIADGEQENAQQIADLHGIKL